MAQMDQANKYDLFWTDSIIFDFSNTVFQ